MPQNNPLGYLSPEQQRQVMFEVARRSLGSPMQQPMDGMMPGAPMEQPMDPAAMSVPPQGPPMPDMSLMQQQGDPVEQNPLLQELLSGQQVMRQIAEQGIANKLLNQQNALRDARYQTDPQRQVEAANETMRPIMARLANPGSRTQSYGGHSFKPITFGPRRSPSEDFDEAAYVQGGDKPLGTSLGPTDMDAHRRHLQDVSDRRRADEDFLMQVRAQRQQEQPQQAAGSFGGIDIARLIRQRPEDAAKFAAIISDNQNSAANRSAAFDLQSGRQGHESRESQLARMAQLIMQRGQQEHATSLAEKQELGALKRLGITQVADTARTNILQANENARAAQARALQALDTYARLAQGNLADTRAQQSHAETVRSNKAREALASEETRASMDANAIKNDEIRINDLVTENILTRPEGAEVARLRRLGVSVNAAINEIKKSPPPAARPTEIERFRRIIEPEPGKKINPAEFIEAISRTDMDKAMPDIVRVMQESYTPSELESARPSVGLQIPFWHTLSGSPWQSHEWWDMAKARGVFRALQDQQ